jgi:hypothetical protein
MSPDPNFDPEEMKDKSIWWFKKTWNVDWSGWLEKQFKKLFKEDKNEVLGKDEGSV